MKWVTSSVMLIGLPDATHEVDTRPHASRIRTARTCGALHLGSAPQDAPTSPHHPSLVTSSSSDRLGEPTSGSSELTVAQASPHGFM